MDATHKTFLPDGSEYSHSKQPSDVIQSQALLSILCQTVNGLRWTKEEFFNYYGVEYGRFFWNEACRRLAEQDELRVTCRVASRMLASTDYPALKQARRVMLCHAFFTMLCQTLDGIRWTKQEFCDCCGLDCAQFFWNEAIHRVAMLATNEPSQTRSNSLRDDADYPLSKQESQVVLTQALTIILCQALDGLRWTRQEFFDYYEVEHAQYCWREACRRVAEQHVPEGDDM